MVRQVYANLRVSPSKFKYLLNLSGIIGEYFNRWFRFGCLKY